MNEPQKPVPPTNAGGKTGAGNPQPVPPPTIPPPPVVPPPGSAPALFGGHRGGGKKRLDGLPAGSPEAKEADRKADAERKRLERAQKKGASLPPPLPSVAASPANASVPVAGGDAVVLAAPAGVVGAGVAPMFVAWQQKLLDKPAKLLAKITDRWRGYCRFKAVRKLNLSPAAEKEILEKMKWREDVLNDFATALSEATTIELNKRRVPGAEHGHWVTLSISLGELVYLEITNMQTIEKLILDDRAKNPVPTDGTPPTNN